MATHAVPPMLRVHTRVGEFEVPAFVLGSKAFYLQTFDFEELPDDVQAELLFAVEDHVEGVVEHVALVERTVN